jgi:hypothetical protein
MLSKEDNEALTRVGPGTLMGSLLRQYWQPILRSSELADRDGTPVRVRLLGEELFSTHRSAVLKNAVQLERKRREQLGEKKRHAQ